MKGKVILFSAMALLMVFAFAAPVFAFPVPSHGTFTQGITQVQISPGTAHTIGDVEYSTGAVDSAYLFGAPWGNSLSASTTNIYSQLNTQTYVGEAVDRDTDIYAAGVVNGIIIADYAGVGSYTYDGPTFAFSLAGRTGTFTHGDSYFGVLGSGFANKWGVSGELKGLVTKETFTYVFVIKGSNAGMLLVDNTVEYWFP